jgi:hypothetical protein
MTAMIPTESPAQRNWPKPYLLQCYAEAVAQGCIRISPIEESAVPSFRQTFYRLRRRVDREARAYILPEYHLVTVSAWSPDYGGCVYLVFSSVPDNEPPLPTISGVEPGFQLPVPIARPTPPPPPADFSPDAPIPVSDLQLDVSDIDPDDYLSALRQAAAERTND